MSSLAHSFLNFQQNHEPNIPNGSEVQEKLKNQENIYFQTNKNLDLLNLVKILIDEDTCCINC